MMLQRWPIVPESCKYDHLEEKWSKGGDAVVSDLTSKWL